MVTSDFRRAARRVALEKSVELSRGADVAVVKLIVGKPREAVEYLERDVLLLPGSGRLLSDLSASYLEWARQSGKGYLIFKALACADRALDSPNPPVEAGFNRALALERLSLVAAAGQAWRTYLEHDHTSAWAAEAKARVKALNGPTAEEIQRKQQSELERAARAGDPEAVHKLVHRLHQPARLTGEGLVGKWAVAALSAMRSVS
jgi:hypothetical protein